MVSCEGKFKNMTTYIHDCTEDDSAKSQEICPRKCSGNKDFKSRIYKDFKEVWQSSASAETTWWWNLCLSNSKNYLLAGVIFQMPTLNLKEACRVQPIIWYRTDSLIWHIYDYNSTPIFILKVCIEFGILYSMQF